MGYLYIALLAIPALFMGDQSWVIYIVSIPILAWWWAHAGRRMLLLLTAACGLVLTSHALGYKIYGSATIHENQPLPGAEEVVDFEPPNILVLESGAQIELKGYELHESWQHEPLEVLRETVIRYMQSKGLAIDPSLGLSTVQVRNSYWCGNTFFPCFFPKRLPRYSSVDWDTFALRYSFPDWIFVLQDKPTSKEANPGKPSQPHNTQP